MLIRKLSILSCFLLLSFKVNAWEVPFNPDSSLLNTPEHQESIHTLLWLTKSSVILVCSYLLVSGSKLLNDENYYQASLTLMGALIAGGATYYAVPLA